MNNGPANDQPASAFNFVAHLFLFHWLLLLTNNWHDPINYVTFIMSNPYYFSEMPYLTLHLDILIRKQLDNYLILSVIIFHLPYYLKIFAKWIYFLVGGLVSFCFSCYKSIFFLMHCICQNLLSHKNHLSVFLFPLFHKFI